jgi:hypothetical protein
MRRVDAPLWHPQPGAGAGPTDHEVRAMSDDRHDPRPSNEPAAGDGPHDGREQAPGVHPEVERSSRSRTTAIAFAVAMAAAGLLYFAIVLGITTGG